MSRAAHDAALSEWYRIAWEHNRELQARYDALLEKYHALAMPTPPIVAPPPVPVERTPSPVTLAIREQADGDPALASYLRSYATKLAREGLTNSQIIDKLGQWETTEPNPLEPK